MEALNEIKHFIRRRNLLAHIGIWLLAILVLTISTVVFRGQLFGILYLTFFLAFILTYQTSYRLWARTIKTFCTLLVLYSLIIATMIFIYQLTPYLDGIISSEILENIGLVHNPKDFRSYIGPIMAIILSICIILYLGIFHDDFHRFIYLASEDDLSLSTPLTGSQIGVTLQNSINDSTFIRLSSNSLSSPSNESLGQQQNQFQTTSLDNPPTIVPIPSTRNDNDPSTIGHDKNTKRKLDWRALSFTILECLWKLVESHYIKVVYFMIFRLAIVDIGLIQYPLLIIVIIALMLPSIEYSCCVIASWLISAIMLTRNIYHLIPTDALPVQFISKPNCSTDATLQSSWSDYLGLNQLIYDGKYSEDHVSLGQHLLVILMITLSSFTVIHRNRRSDYKEYERSFGVIFSGIGRREADKSIINAIKYLSNFGFYQFGIEITCLTLIIAVSNRLDVIAALYGVILILISVTTSKSTLSKVWSILSLIVSLCILFEYLFILGIPEPLCTLYPWKLSQETIDWLFLPSYGRTSIQIYAKLDYMLYDFLVLLAMSRQSLVFQYTAPTYIKSVRTHEAEFRDRYLPTRSEFRIEDYFTNPQTPIKFLKMTFFVTIYWITLTAVLVAGATKISLFSLGYLTGCFIFLFLGNDAYLLPVPRLIFNWNVFILYSSSVILVKVFLQLVTCQYHDYLTDEKRCSILQLLHVVCYDRVSKRDQNVPDTCHLSELQGPDISWDGLCLMFLLMQRVVFGSQYFRFLISEVKAQQILASRGAELIMATQIEEAKGQANYDRTVMKTIRQKMEDLKTEGEETSKAWQRLLNLPHHHQIIRNADRHLFSTKLDDSISDCRTDDNSFRRDYIPDPLGQELEKMDEVNGISAVLTRWMKGEQPFIERRRSSIKKRTKLASPSQPKSIKSAEGSTTSEQLLIRNIESSTSLANQDEPAQQSGLIDSTVSEVEVLDVQSEQINEEPIASSSRDSFDMLSDSETDSDPETKQGYFWFLNNLTYSFLLTATVRLNKLSTSYRYVSRRMDAEKDRLKKSRYDLNDERFKRDQSWRKSVINSLSHDYNPSNTDRINLKLNMFTQFCRALGYVVISNTSLLCQIIIIVNQVYSTSLLSLPLPLLTFLWGTLSVPRPTKRYWKTVISITEIVIVVKYVCQFPVWKIDKSTSRPFSTANLLGINDNNGGSTIVIDLILLLSLFFHRSRLKSLGQWNATSEFSSESNLHRASLIDPTTSMQPKQSSGEISPRSEMSSSPNQTHHTDLAIHQSLAVDKNSNQHLEEKKYSISVEPCHSESYNDYLRESYQQNADSSISAGDQLGDPNEVFDNSSEMDTDDGNKKSCFSIIYYRIHRSVAMFFHHVLNTPHPVSTDVYTPMFICDFINFLILIYGFWAFGTGYTNESVASFINENKVPSSVLFMLFVQFASIMIDRYLYLKKYIKLKLAYQVILVIAIHIWLFFVLPTLTGRSLTFKENWPPKLFYIFKCIYFLLSAYQIRCGYPRRVLGYCFTKGFGYTNLGLIKIYRAIPLLYDLRIYMDWIWTDTTLEFRNWYIMEDMFSNLFIRKCELTLEEEYPIPRAQPQSRISKYLYGGVFIILILSIVWGPLLLFSMGKTVGESNPPLELEYQLEIVGYEPLLKLRASTNQITGIDDEQYSKLKSNLSSSCQTFFGDYKSNDIRIISLEPNSASLWAISPPNRNALTSKALSNSNVTIKSSLILYRERKQKANNLDTITGLIQKNSTWVELGNLLNGTKTENTTVIPVPIFPSLIRVPESGSISLVQCVNQYDEAERYLSLTYFKENGTNWWQATNANVSAAWSNIESILVGQTKSLVIVAFNDRVFTGILALLSGSGIIGLYTTFVIFFARLIRNEPAGKVIYTELPKVDRVYGLVMDIYMMRESREFELEEKLFAKLLFLYRCPELLIEWSKREDEPRTNLAIT